MVQTVLRADIVIQCLAELRQQRIHRNFAGYLCVKRTAARDGRTDNLRPSFREFFDTFLKVPGGPVKKPYVLPFSESETSSNTGLWFNENVAGSYAPSSLRPGKAFLNVVTVSGSNKSAVYSLKEYHWKLARIHFGFDQKIPVVPLAVFLYRDFAIQTEHPDASSFVAIFRQEFGYSSAGDEDKDTEFNHLYFDDSRTRSSANWFEALV